MTTTQHSTITIDAKETIDPGAEGPTPDGMVDISGIDKVKLLEQLWLVSKIAKVFVDTPWMAATFDHVKARGAVRRYIDYFCGRVIRTDLSKSMANPRMYDRNNGDGKFAEVVRSLKC